MNDIARFFANLTQPQAEALSAASGLLSALIVAVGAPLVFHLLTSRGLRSFEESVSQLKNSAETASKESHKVSGSIHSISDNIKDLNLLLSSVQERVAETQNTILEAQPERLEQAAGEAALPTDNREKVKSIWRSFRDVAERAAAEPRILGQTRAKYGRMDRRGYWAFLKAVSKDGNLPGDLAIWEDAYRIYSAAVHNKDFPTNADTNAQVEQLSRLLLEITAAAADRERSFGAV